MTNIAREALAAIADACCGQKSGKDIHCDIIRLRSADTTKVDMKALKWISKPSQDVTEIEALRNNVGSCATRRDRLDVYNKKK